MKKKRRWICLVLAAALAAAVFAGCGEAGDSDTTLSVLYDSSMIPLSGVASETLESMRLLAEGSKKDDSLYQCKFTHAKDMIATMDGLGYDVDYQDWGWAEQLRQKQVSAFLAGYGADLFIGEDQMVEFAREGSLKPFPESLETWIRENVVPSAYKACEVDGKIYGVSFAPSVAMLIINKRLVTEIFGVAYEAPATWDELISQMEQINVWTAENNKKQIIPGGSYLGNSESGYLRYYSFFKQAGAQFVDAEGKPTFDTAAVQKTLAFFRSMNAQNTKGILTSNHHNGFLNVFNQNEAVFSVDGSWTLEQAKEYGQELTVAPLPLPDEGAVANSNIVVGAPFYGVPSYVSEKKAEAAFAYIRAGLGDVTQNAVRDALYKCTVRKGLVNDAFLAANPELAKFYEAFTAYELETIPPFGFENSKCWSEVGKAVLNAATTAKGFPTITKAAQEQLNLYYGRK